MNDITERLVSRYRSGVRDFRGEDLSGLRLGLRESLAGCDFTDCMFTDCVFGGGDFSNTSFDGVKFESCNAMSTTFINCSFDRSHLMGSHFGSADFYKATFTDANLIKVNFREAYFGSTKLIESRVVGCHFVQSVFGFTDIQNTLIGICDVNDIIMLGPCDIDHQTLSLSLNTSASLMQKVLQLSEDTQTDAVNALWRGKVQSLQKFFIAGGVSSDLVRAYSGSHTWLLPGEYSSVFISYSTEDQEFADRLHEYLSSLGITVWFAPHDIKGGKRIEEQVSTAITKYSKLVLILSEASMKSSWVSSELRIAMDLERKHGSQKLYPIRIVSFDLIRQWRLFDSDHGTDLAQVVREYFIPDFSEWRSGVKFGAAANRLVNDLRN